MASSGSAPQSYRTRINEFDFDERARSYLGSVVRIAVGEGRVWVVVALMWLCVTSMAAGAGCVA